MRTDWTELARLCDAGEAVLRRKMLEDGITQQTYAYAAGFPTKHPDWRELKMWIDPVMSAEVEAAALLGDLLAKTKKLRLFYITRDDRMITLADAFGFKLIGLGILPGDMEPIDWAYTVGAVCRLPRSVHWPPPIIKPTDERLLVL